LVVAARVLVLGVVRMYRRAHGYQVRQTLLSWGADEWASVHRGSIYHALGKLAGDGLLDALGSVQGMSAPSRTVYRTTTAGEQEFERLVVEGLCAVDRGKDAFIAALTFITTLPRERACRLLETRAAALEKIVVDRQDALAAARSRKPAHASDIYEFATQIVECELRWVRDEVVRLRDGHLVMADDSPDHFGSAGSLDSGSAH
jgi:DNA-binding PadR family transcriptional regulator